MLRRFFSTSSVNQQSKKKLSDFLGHDEETGLKIIKSSPTIYNVEKSASNYKGYLKAKVPEGFYYHPTQSSNTGSINSETIPVSFMSINDPRRNLPHVKKQYTYNKKVAQLAPLVLPNQNVTRSTGKTYHLQQKDVEEIQKLRNENPDKYTRKELAKMFNVSPLFISLVSSAPKDRLQEMDRRLNVIKSGWSTKRQLARDDRLKRKDLWTRA